jgi:hypothetical protein
MAAHDNKDGRTLTSGCDFQRTNYWIFSAAGEAVYAIDMIGNTVV